MHTYSITSTMLLLITVLLSGGLYAQTASLQKSAILTEAGAESVGMSSERLARIDAMCKQAIADMEVPGIVAMVVRKGKVVFHEAYGQADVGRSLKKDDIFRIASQTKAITATAVMMLWEEGRFQLDDPISKYIPEFAETAVLERFNYADTSFTTKPLERPITVRHLLTHTSGIGYGVIDGDERFQMMYHKAGITDLFTTEPITIGESIKKLAGLPLHHQPGEDFTYSEGLDVLGYFIEIISGMSFSDFLQERLFKPLGMKDTHFYLPADRAKRLVAVQEPSGGGWSRFPVTFYDPDYPAKGARQFYSGGAGLSSTAKDYATFLQMYLNGGELNGVRILSPTTVKAIMGDQAGDTWGNPGSHYGLAFEVINQHGQDLGGRGSVGTFSWGGYFNTQYFADPVEQIIGILMKQTQRTQQDNTGWRFRLLVGQAVDE